MNRFAKLMSTMGGQKEVANPGIDNRNVEFEDKARELQAIDDKISQLESSDDPNSLESLNFWKQHRDRLAARLSQSE